MRLRNIPGAREEMLVNPFVVQNPQELKGHWKQWFAEEKGMTGAHPLYIEIGMGKGKFLTTLAAQNPNKLYVGIEKYSSVLLRALEKQEELQLPNLCFIRMDAETIGEIFGEQEVDGIYLNFSDPWPKDRHAKRRLTSVQFLGRYEGILSDAGQVEFKTDNKGLFEFSLEEVNESEGWELLAHTFDLHHQEDMMEGNVMTEYEEKFSSMGNPICKLIAVLHE